jgi:hypothetical protein
MRVLVALAVFVISFSLLCGSVILAARQQPLPGWLAALHFDVCKPPCWIGIEPGQATLNEAVARIKAVYMPPEYTVRSHADNQNTLEILHNDKCIVTVSFNLSDQQIIKTIDFLWTGADELSIGQRAYADIHGFLGTPSYLSIQSWGGDILLTYPVSKGTVHVASWLSRDKSRREQANSNIEYRSVSLVVFSRSEVPSFRGIETLTWRGFLPLSTYKKMLCLKTGCR